MKRSFFASALTAGLVAGILDITAACIHAYLRNGTTPEQVLRGIAGGAFGKESIINAIIGAVILMVCIGLPNALLARRYLRTKA